MPSDEEGCPDCPDCARFEPRWDTVEVCRECGLGRTVGPTRSPEAQDYIERDPAAQRQRRHYFERLMRRHARHVRGRTALDVGCAGGEFLDVLQRDGWQVRGLDAHPDASVDARIVQQPIEKWECAECFDLITMVHSLEHFADPRATLRRAHELSAPGGHLLIVVPHFGGRWARMKGVNWDWLNPEDHCFHYTIPVLRRIVEACGFRTVKLATDSSAGPSLVQASLALVGFYDSAFGKRQPVRGITFRVANRLARPAGWLADQHDDGAELVMLARRDQAP